METAARKCVVIACCDGTIFARYWEMLQHWVWLIVAVVACVCCVELACIGITRWVLPAYSAPPKAVRPRSGNREAGHRGARILKRSSADPAMHGGAGMARAKRRLGGLE